MKAAIVSLFFLVTGVAHAGDLQHWVEESQRKVYFAYRPELRVKVTNVAADDEFWDSLTIEVSYDNPRMSGAIASLQAHYPGYALSRVIMDKEGGFKVAIPAIA